MKKSSKIALISVSSAIAAVSVAVYASKPENYIKRHFPNAQVLNVRHGVSGFMFDRTPYIEYRLYDPENEVTFIQLFDDGIFHRPYNAHHSQVSYDYYMEIKSVNDRMLAKVPEFYSGEYFGRYDLNSQGLYIFLKEPEYEAVRDLMTGLNASEGTVEYMLYCLPADIYERMKEQNFKRLSIMYDKPAYHTYCFEIVEMFLGYMSSDLGYKDDLTPDVFELGGAVIIKSGYEGASGTQGIIHINSYF